jgi:transcriptional regulator with XRE-family HTH domain
MTGARMRELRRAAGVSQGVLAARLGVIRQYVGRMEAGRDRISLERTLAIANALGLNPHDLDANLVDRPGKAPTPKPAAPPQVRNSAPPARRTEPTPRPERRVERDDYSQVGPDED